MTRVCPWWLGYFLLNPFRSLVQDPERIVSPYVKAGMKVLEVGPGMGFFTFPLARLVGESGKIYAVDLQERMIRALKRRMDKRGLASRVEARVCSEHSLQVGDLTGSIDFAIAFAVVHEVPDPRQLFREMVDSLKQGGIMLLSEPRGHVSTDEFAASRRVAEDAGLQSIAEVQIWRSHSLLFSKGLAPHTIRTLIV